MSNIFSRGTFTRPRCIRQVTIAPVKQQWPRHIRVLQNDDRTRYSQLWVPTVLKRADEPDFDGKSLLMNNGFIEQPLRRSGVFHFLPLGLRVLERLERLLDKHMRSLGASKVSLSSLSQESVWQTSGRLKGRLADGDHELFGVVDRKDSGLLLCPTHEEEITMLVKHFIVSSSRHLPLLVYQISRKYRDELRPRGGLLRTKEFIMKDLYSFDGSKSEAIETYDFVRQAYDNFFSEIGIPFLVAEADSGNMGGNLSHEYHYESPHGEDTVWTCSSCKYTANDEVVVKREDVKLESPTDGVKIWKGISKDRSTNISVVYPSKDTSTVLGSLKSLNIAHLKEINPGLDSSIERLPAASPNMRFQSFIKHPSLSQEAFSSIIGSDILLGPDTTVHTPEQDFLKVQDDDPCPRCETGKLTSHRTIEVGHTFFLGDRYTAPFRVTTASYLAEQSVTERNNVQMGCYGIGVTRLLGAVAEMGVGEMSVAKRSMNVLNWPRKLAPFDVVIIYDPRVGEHRRVATDLYDSLTLPSPSSSLPSLDVVLDDRHQDLPFRMVDADIRGIPIVVVIGKKYDPRRKYVEVQCRGLGLHSQISAHRARDHIHAALRWLDTNYKRPGPPAWPTL